MTPRNLRHLRSLRHDERGTSMTEFVIGLPVFILIFSGILALTKIHGAALQVSAQANANLWENASPGAGSMIPLGAIMSVSSLGDLFQNGASALGIYADSGMKAQIPVSLLPGTKPASVCYTVGCTLGGADSESFSWNLLNDNAADGAVNGDVNASGWANLISSALTVSGARPAFAAGIRYGSVEGEAPTKTVTVGNWGTFDLQPGVLDIPAITQPTHRMFAVALTRIEFAKDDFWNKQVPDFDSDFDFNSAGGSSGAGDQCSAALDSYNNCLSSGPQGETQSEAQERCEGAAPGNACDDIGGSNPLGSIGTGWCGGAVGCP